MRWIKVQIQFPQIFHIDITAHETIPLTLTGNLKEEAIGTPITGEDCVWVLNPGGESINYLLTKG